MGLTTIESSVWAALLVAIMTFICKTVFRQEWQNLPPGPRGLPIIGYLHKLCSKPIHIIMNELAKKFGDVYSMRLGSRLTVVLNSRESIYETFIKRAKLFSGRPDLATFNKTRHGCVGISMCDYTAAYIKNRQMTVRSMHELYLDGTYLKNMFHEESFKMINCFDEMAKQQRIFNPIEQFYKIVPSVVINFVFGKSLSYDDAEVIELVTFNRKWFESAESNNPADFFKVLEKFPNKRLKAIEDSGAAFYGYVLKQLRKHEEGTKCLLQSYLDIYRKNIGKVTFSEMEELELARVVADMLGGGFDTVALTLSWSVLYLHNRKDIIEKCRRELNEVFGTNEVSHEEYRKLPYFCATIYDILRLSSVAPMGLPRNTTDNVKMRNFTIPKNTMIFANLWAVNRDENFWQRPSELYPEHFLTDDGRFDAAALRKLATFSFGVRKCPGEKFAFFEMFVFLGTLLKYYNINLVRQPRDMEPSNGLTSQPKLHTIQISMV